MHIMLDKDMITNPQQNLILKRNDCNFLYEDPEVLVWSNDKSAKLNNMLGTGDDFILTDYAPNK